MKRISIVIVTYNSGQDIYNCLASVFKHADLPADEIETIVVDNGSDDVEAMFSRLREMYGNSLVLVRNTHNGGYGQGNNVGIRMATAPVVMVVNPDVLLIEPVLKTAVEAFERDACVGIYGMKQMLSEHRPSSNSFACTYMMNGYLFTLLSAICNRRDWYMQRCMWLSGSCFFIRKDMFEAVGLFDEDVFMYGEEDDVRVRMMRRYGKCIVYNPALHYIHLGGNRPVTSAYLCKQMDVAVLRGEKLGYPARQMLKERLRSINFLLLRARLYALLGRKADVQMLRETKMYLEKRMAEL